MSTSRLSAFTDGVIAILITVMVLELRSPHDGSWRALGDTVPVLLAYVLSFINIGIYWNNHHHLLAVVGHINGTVLWANLHLLFWLSLIPFCTAWMSENAFRPAPVAAYGIVLLACALAYYLLQTILVRAEGAGSLLAEALGTDLKGKLSPALYVVAIGLSFVERWLSLAVYVAVALMWLVPDRRVERRIIAAHGSGDHLRRQAEDLR